MALVVGLRGEPLLLARVISATFGHLSSIERMVGLLENLQIVCFINMLHVYCLPPDPCHYQNFVLRRVTSLRSS